MMMQGRRGLLPFMIVLVFLATSALHVVKCSSRDIMQALPTAGGVKMNSTDYVTNYTNFTDYMNFTNFTNFTAVYSNSSVGMGGYAPWCPKG